MTWPEPKDTLGYIEAAPRMRDDGNRFAFAVTDEASGTVLGTTSFHDILPAVKRVEIGYTWYARRCQRTHVNTTCKLLMLTHAFDTLDCHVVGWRTDNFNHASQRAIERLAREKTASSAATRCAATAPSATPSCTACARASGPRCAPNCSTCWTSPARTLRPGSDSPC